MIQEDATRVLELHGQIKALECKIEEVARRSRIYKSLNSVPGFGPICSSELSDEIGILDRFRKEGNLALYLGMSNLDDSSGKHKGSKAARHVNSRAKAAMMTAVDRHRKQVVQSQQYYEKKREEGKTHNQAIRAPGRHLCRVIYRILKEERDYQIRK